MKKTAIALIVILLAGCGSLAQQRAEDDYNAKMAANASEFGNGQIPLSEKVRRDTMVSIQYNKLNTIEIACSRKLMNLAQKHESGKIDDDTFANRFNALELDCSHAYATGNSLVLLGKDY